MSSILEALYEGDICPAERFQIDTEAVSYTHLTLPTTPYV